MYSSTLLLAIFGASSVLALPLDLQTEAAGVDIRTVGKRTAGQSDWAHGSDCASENLTGCVGGHGEQADITSPRVSWGPAVKSWVNPPSNGEDADITPPRVGWGPAGKRWVNPPSTIPVVFGTACSLETCDMCPSFPGCEKTSGDDDAASGDDAGNEDPPKSKDQKRWVDPITTLPTEFGTACSLETCHMCPSFPGCGTGEMRAGRDPEMAAADDRAPPPAAVSAVKRDVQIEEPTVQPVALRKNWQQPPSRLVKREANISPIVTSGGVKTGAGPECSILTCDLCPDHPGCSEGGQTWDDGDGDDQPPK